MGTAMTNHLCYNKKKKQRFSVFGGSNRFERSDHICTVVSVALEMGHHWVMEKMSSFPLRLYNARVRVAISMGKLWHI